jgi:energy-coupling factor transporter ATP-binding protein EcfA2
MIDIKCLSYCYADSEEQALQNINLNISVGEFVGVTGPTGAGKSTLAACLNGVIPHFQKGDFYGVVKIGQHDTVESNCADLAISVGSVFQDPEAQIISEVVEDEIAFGLENLNIPEQEISNRITEGLRMAGISDLRYSLTRKLSGGQKQRVAVAAAIALRPRILVLDEPTSELDPQGTEDIFVTLQKLNIEYNITIVVIEQKMQLLQEYCSRLVVMDKGHIVLDGPVRDVLAHQQLLQEIGVNCSPVVRLAYMLKQEGLYNGDFPVNVEEAMQIIKGVMGNDNL